MAFTAKDVAALREKTGCGMMDWQKSSYRFQRRYGSSTGFPSGKRFWLPLRKRQAVLLQKGVCVCIYQ